jgi:hypothetical protein
MLVQIISTTLSNEDWEHVTVWDQIPRNVAQNAFNHHRKEMERARQSFYSFFQNVSDDDDGDVRLHDEEQITPTAVSSHTEGLPPIDGHFPTTECRRTSFVHYLFRQLTGAIGPISTTTTDRSASCGGQVSPVDDGGFVVTLSPIFRNTGCTRFWIYPVGAQCTMHTIIMGCRVVQFEDLVGCVTRLDELCLQAGGSALHIIGEGLLRNPPIQIYLTMVPIGFFLGKKKKVRTDGNGMHLCHPDLSESFGGACPEHTRRARERAVGSVLCDPTACGQRRANCRTDAIAVTTSP